jgi:hypothetical protein
VNAGEPATDIPLGSIQMKFGWTGYEETKMLITVQRKTKTSDGIMGQLKLDWNPFTCVTLENLKLSIPAGTYDLNFTYSPHFNRIMPHLIVPSRDSLAGGDAGIRIHWANFPAQLDGCIAVGTMVDGDSIDESLIPFNQLYAILNMQAGIQIQVNDIVA